MLAMDRNWKSMKEGNKNAFLIIYKENYNILFSYGFSLTCDKELTKDCLQEMFLELWNTRTSLNADVQNVNSYLRTWLRRKISRLQSAISKERSEPSQIVELSYEDLLIAFQENEEKKKKLSRALNNLTQKQLEIIRLKFFENLSYAEISDRTSLTTRTIYNTICIAICQLRKSIVSVEHV